MKDLALAVRFARRELRGGLKGFRVFLACLILGVAAIAGVGSFAAGITRALQEDARVLLGGDLELSFTHRSATPEQLAAMARTANVSTIAEMRAMARTDAARTLVELKAVDTAYPLLGTVGMDNGAPLQDALARRDGMWGAVLERATLVRLGLAAGDSFQVGDARFVVRAVIEREPDRTANVFTLGPRVMIALAALPDTGLIQPGSLVRYEYRLLVKQPGTGDRVAASLRDQFPDAGWRIRGLSEATPGVQRWIDRIAMFLTLVGLSALLVGGVGVANAVRAYLDSKTQTIAVFKCLGAPGRLVMLVYLVQVLALAALAIAIGLVIGAAIPSLVGPLVADKLPVAARTGLYPGPLAVAAGFGLLTTLAFTLWPVARTREVPAAALFRDLVAPLRRWPRPLAIVGTVLAVTALAALGGGGAR
jgi:putative ABC transport system permease protein